MKLLCESKESVSKVARDLDIGRVQFNRYLKSESFPKPAVLKRICDYFDVDARMYTEPLSEINAIDKKQTIPKGSDYLIRSMEYINSIADYYVPTDEFPDGIHSFWRMSFADESNALRSILQIKTVNGVRTIHGFDSRKQYESHTDWLGYNAREYRGVLLKQLDGYALLFFSQPPDQVVGASFFSRDDLYTKGILVGFQTLLRGEMRNKRRFTRSIIELLPQNTKTVLAAARKKGPVELSEVPEAIRKIITADVT